MTPAPTGGRNSPRPSGADDGVLATRLRLVVGRLNRQLRGRQIGGLSPSQLSALSSIDRHGPMRLGDLAAVECISPPSLTPIVTSLDVLDLIRRYRDPDDGRQVLAAVTDDGRRLLDQVRGEYTAHLAAGLGRIRDADRQTLEAAIGILEHLVDDDETPG